MDLSKLSDLEIESALIGLCDKEREGMVKILYHLIEIDNRRSFVNSGYSSLFDYCTRKLKYSPSSAYRRISAARCLKDIPELDQRLLSGEVTLCSVAAAANELKSKEVTVTEILNKSTREIEKFVLKHEVPAKPKEVIQTVKIAMPDAPLQPTNLVEERVSIKFTLTKEMYRNFEEVTALLSNTIGPRLTVEAVLGKLLELYLTKPKSRARKNPRSRVVPKSLKREIFDRDGGECSYMAPDGTKCTAKHNLQIDHIVPYAVGGTTELSNLRLLCPSHNRLMAENYFGKSFIQEKLL